MTLKDAKQVAVSMSEKSFVLPPRRVDDILVLLDQPSKYDRELLADLYIRVGATPPDTTSSSKLASFYYSRGMAARGLGLYHQCLADARKSNAYREDTQTLKLLSTAEAYAGNFQNAIRYASLSIQIKETSSGYYLLAVYYSWTGDLTSCEETVIKGLSFIRNNELRATGRWASWLYINKNRLKAALYHAKGQYSKAEPFMRAAVRELNKRIKETPLAYLHAKNKLDMNIAFQGRLIEAEQSARETLNESIGLTGKASGTTADCIINLGEILLMQGRLVDSEKLLRKGVFLFERSKISEDAAWVNEAKSNLIKILVAKQNYAEAVKLLREIKANMVTNQYDFKKIITRNPNMMITLLLAGEMEEAINSINTTLAMLQKYLGENHYQTAEILGLRGIYNSVNENQEQAIVDFSKSIPVILNKKDHENDYLKTIRLRIIVEAYIDLLSKIHARDQGKKYNISVAEEIFRLCESINNSLVKRAVDASGARAAAANPELADLVRREQDAAKQIKSLKQTLSNALAASFEQINILAISNLKTVIDSLSKAKNTISNEIKNKFPKYDDFINPQSPGFSELKANLYPEEALVVIYPANDKTFVWGIPKEGKVAFAIAPVSKNDLQNMMTRLRRTLSPIPGTYGDIPNYNLALAHDIYTLLLKPIEAGWKKAQDLIIVASPPMGQIPFSVLPIEPVKISQDTNYLFEMYRKVPWLIRNYSISNLPSVSSLVTLRSIPKGDPNRRTFLGFGDPYFNAKQMEQALGSKNGKNEVAATRSVSQLRIRGIRITEVISLDSSKLISAQIGMLGRLPDTAEEIESIAKTLDADPTQDIFLGENATEGQVKRIDLENRKIVAFATHGLIPGDLDGLDQEALALCSPAVAKDGEDGLLTMGEILKLKMNTDWVVLSACNTGAGEGAGAEAVSGLGRAFFYAGSRALLVSMWSVESTSAKKLTTGLFRLQKENQTLSRAKALQKSILDLIDKQYFKDKSTGKIVASYAHPFLWAPFVVVGDGR